ncbi:hypothetical protein MRX96_054132 [Rhipicephalus microplus]
MKQRGTAAQAEPEVNVVDVSKTDEGDPRDAEMNRTEPDSKGDSRGADIDDENAMDFVAATRVGDSTNDAEAI